MDKQVVFFHTLGDTNLGRAEDAMVFVPPSLVGVLDGAKPYVGEGPAGGLEKGGGGPKTPALPPGHPPPLYFL